MRPWIAFLPVVAWAGPPPGPLPLPTPAAQARSLRAAFPSPQERMKAMVAQDQAQRKTPGAVVEVVGTDDVTALRLLSLHVGQQVRLAFRPMDSLGQRELYAFMHQDPAHPASVLVLPRVASPVAAGFPPLPLTPPPATAP